MRRARSAAAKTKGEDRNKGAENRNHVVTVRLAREILQCFPASCVFCGLAATGEQLVATHLSFPSVCHVAVAGDDRLLG